ncbi:hypothetical protein GCM10027275_13220 [Rhabdobacter roseus]|uniref:GMP synthase-like glutamine amidotransferase n=1 Tax=Rhabdobacter roseus TaxID=1655419 RepID=A0A840TT88_9BACT|nr:GMP synthase [Rhabdobacter roseus]MBB5283238.1 GMP synthase-like glutamine amidotransferase [Rhabdobacter roseus]
MNKEKAAFRVAILDLYNGVENEGMRCIKKIITDFGQQEALPITYEVFDVRQYEQVPGLDFDAYISTGGPGSPSLTGAHWERKFFHFLDHLWAYNADRRQRVKKPLFLICHSFQMACLHWNIGHVGKRRSTSFGTYPVHLTQAGLKEPLFSGLQDPFWVVDSRDYQVIQPNYPALESLGAKVLCLEKIRPHVKLERALMAIRFSKDIFGTQFHPEADAEGMLRYFLKEEKKEQIIKNHGEAKYNDMIEHLNDPEKILLTESVVLPNFLKRAVAQTLSTQPA